MKTEILNGKVVHKFESFVDVNGTTYQVVIRASGDEPWKGSVYLNGKCVRDTLPEAEDILERTWRRLWKS